MSRMSQISVLYICFTFTVKTPRKSGDLCLQIQVWAKKNQVQQLTRHIFPSAENIKFKIIRLTSAVRPWLGAALKCSPEFLALCRKIRGFRRFVVQSGDRWRKEAFSKCWDVIIVAGQSFYFCVKALLFKGKEFIRKITTLKPTFKSPRLPSLWGLFLKIGISIISACCKRKISTYCRS